MKTTEDMNSIFVLFGGTGDLTFKKLMPAFYHLLHEHMIPKKFAIVAIGRKELSHREYRVRAREAIEKHGRFQFEDWRWRDLADHIYYFNMDFNDREKYSDLEIFLNDLDNRYDTRGNKLFYLATSPSYFEVIVKSLNIWACMKCGGSWNRIIIEKPFGHDLESASRFNLAIQDVFSEECIYRIDHYLGKEMIQNIMVLRFANQIFDPIWNKDNIDHVQITLSERDGIGHRGNYYEKSGALRDMVQSHIMQIISLVAMERPSEFNMSQIQNEKLKVLKSISLYSDGTLKNNVVFGQYIARNSDEKSYVKEDQVDENSKTETFVAMKVCIDNDRWEGVPFYIRTGKHMKKNTAKVIIVFKELASDFRENLEPNMLVIRIQPQEGVDLKFNLKTPGAVHEIKSANMDFCQNCEHDSHSPEAYEKLLYDAYCGDITLFSSWVEVEAAWNFIDKITKTCIPKEELTFDYEIGSWGPEKSDELIKSENREWLDL